MTTKTTLITFSTSRARWTKASLNARILRTWGRKPTRMTFTSKGKSKKKMTILWSRFWNWGTQRVPSKCLTRRSSRRGTSTVPKGKCRDREEEARAISLPVRTTTFSTKAFAAIKAVTPNWRTRAKDACPLLLPRHKEVLLKIGQPKGLVLPPKSPCYRISVWLMWVTSNYLRRRSYRSSSWIPSLLSTTSTESANRPSRSRTTFSCWRRYTLLLQL